MMINRPNNINEAIVGVDTWTESTKITIYDLLGLSDPIESTNTLEYPIEDSDAFSRVYSKINRSMEFNYSDNESYFDDTTIKLVYDLDGSKLVLFGDLNNNVYRLEVTR